MGYRISTYLTFEVEDGIATLETSHKAFCRLGTAREVARKIYGELSNRNPKTLYVAVFKNDERIFLMSKENMD